LGSAILDWVINAHFRHSEFAVVVHDDYQGKGLGYKLLDMLIGIAQEKGLSEINGGILSDNKRMLKVCEELGFIVTHLPDGISNASLVLK
jgi:acetyltransferase